MVGAYPGPVITRFENVGRQPYDALVTPNGRHYIAGLFGEDGLALVDLATGERPKRRPDRAHEPQAAHAIADHQLAGHKALLVQAINFVTGE